MEAQLDLSGSYFKKKCIRTCLWQIYPIKGYIKGFFHVINFEFLLRVDGKYKNVSGKNTKIIYVWTTLKYLCCFLYGFKPKISCKFEL